MSRLVKDVLIKAGMPSVDDARQRLFKELKTAKHEGFALVKLIHGYGSTGEGGKLRGSLRTSLDRRRKEGLIKGYVVGEKWGTFDERSRDLLASYPELARDPDYNGMNEGITLVEL